MNELYPSQGHGHPASPNLPLPSHGHNPYPSHPIYSPSNLMPLTTPTSIPNSISPTGISGGIENLSQNNVSSFKDENMPSVTSPGSPNATYATNLSSTHNHMVPILGKKLDTKYLTNVSELQ